MCIRDSCYGVQNAINMVEKSIRDSKINIYTLGHIIHNRQVIEKLESQGVYSIDKIEDINAVSYTHLDVYKRQDKAFLRCHVSFDPSQIHQHTFHA